MDAFLCQLFQCLSRRYNWGWWGGGRYAFEEYIPKNLACLYEMVEWQRTFRWCLCSLPAVSKSEGHFAPRSWKINVNCCYALKNMTSYQWKKAVGICCGFPWKCSSISSCLQQNLRVTLATLPSTFWFSGYSCLAYLVAVTFWWLVVEQWCWLRWIAFLFLYCSSYLPFAIYYLLKLLLGWEIH